MSAEQQDPIDAKRFNSLITRNAYELLKREGRRRKGLEARHVPLGCILSEMIEQHFARTGRTVTPKPRKQKAA